MFALFPHPSSSTSKGTTFINNIPWILIHLITLLINVSWDSITNVNDILYLVEHSLSWVILTWYIVFFLRCEIMLCHLTITILLLLHFFFHCIKLQLSLLFLQPLNQYANHICPHSTTLIGKKTFVINLNLYNSFFAQNAESILTNFDL
jgi:hypothetical protein